jgi:CheY-like chemotaxis protein
LFTQVDRRQAAPSGGLGIGLSLARRLMMMHGGSIEARSGGEGLGSEFVARLPVLRAGATATPAASIAPSVAAAPPAMPYPAPSAAAPNRVRRILVVDDNLDAADTLAELLRLCGNETSVAHDGLQALEALESERPEIVLLDIGLPKMDGREVCRRAREQDWSKDMVFVAVTGWGQADDRRQSQEAGFDAHLTKPVAFDALMKLVDTLHPATA